MKKIIFIFSFIIAINVNLEAKSKLGRIIQITGNVDITDVKSEIRFVPGIGTQINAKHRIRTGKNAYVEILLNDNTKIFMRELSVLIVTHLKQNNSSPPTRIKFRTGKVRININKKLKGRNLILKTQSAMIGVSNVETDFAVITTNYETKVVIFEGQADIASAKREIIKSFTLNKKEETSIRENEPPIEPIVLPQEILSVWLDYYKVVGRKRIINKEQNVGGIIDYILRKRNI